MQAIDSVAEVFAGDHVAHCDADTRDFASEELGVALSSFGDFAVILGRDPISAFLTGLGKQDQRRGV